MGRRDMIIIIGSFCWNDINALFALLINVLILFECYHVIAILQRPIGRDLSGGNKFAFHVTSYVMSCDLH